MTKVYALKDSNGKTISHVTIVKYEDKLAIVACNKDGEVKCAGYIAFISYKGLQRISYLSSHSGLPIDDDRCVKEIPFL